MKELESHPHVLRAAIAILNYLRDHPLAKDTARGIAHFWIGETEEIAEKALELLVKEGVVEKNRRMYQLARSAGTIADTNWLHRFFDTE